MWYVHVVSYVNVHMYVKCSYNYANLISFMFIEFVKAIPFFSVFDLFWYCHICIRNEEVKLLLGRLLKDFSIFLYFEWRILNQTNTLYTNQIPKLK